MKQTKEDRAEAYRKDMCILDGDKVRFDSIDIGSARYVAFKAGVEWALKNKTNSRAMCIRDKTKTCNLCHECDTDVLNPNY